MVSLSNEKDQRTQKAASLIFDITIRNWRMWVLIHGLEEIRMRPRLVVTTCLLVNFWLSLQKNASFSEFETMSLYSLPRSDKQSSIDLKKNGIEELLIFSLSFGYALNLFLIINLQKQ